MCSEMRPVYLLNFYLFHIREERYLNIRYSLYRVVTYNVPRYKNNFTKFLRSPFRKSTKFSKNYT